MNSNSKIKEFDDKLPYQDLIVFAKYGWYCRQILKKLKLDYIEEAILKIIKQDTEAII